MLAPTMRIRGTPFKFLPNPLPYRWDIDSFSPVKLLVEFSNAVARNTAQLPSHVSHNNEREYYEGIVTDVGNRASSLRDATENNDELEADLNFKDGLHDALDWCDDRLGVTASTPDTTAPSSPEIMSVVRQLFFLNAENRRWDQDYYNHREPERGVMQRYMQYKLMRILEPGSEGRGLSILRGGISVILMFRMVCWLNLHSFHPADRQLAKSDLWGSRLPVYIS
jgi:hypothetical protein